MDAEFWLKRWDANEIGFHQSKVQPALAAHWAAVSAPADSRVLVPLCGKSHDMDWLASLGHTVIGIEVSERAVDDYFAERGIVPTIAQRGVFKTAAGGRVTLLCGDFFAATADDIGDISAVYDRAALVAMPPEMQARYADQIARLTPPGARMLLIGLDYDPKEMSGPPFAIPQARVRALFADTFEVDVLDARDGLTKSEHLAKRGITRLEEATYMLRRTA